MGTCSYCAALCHFVSPRSVDVHHRHTPCKMQHQIETPRRHGSRRPRPDELHGDPTRGSHPRLATSLESPIRKSCVITSKEKLVVLTLDLDMNELRSEVEHLEQHVVITSFVDQKASPFPHGLCFAFFHPSIYPWPAGLQN